MRKIIDYFISFKRKAVNNPINKKIVTMKNRYLNDGINISEGIAIRGAIM